MVISGHIRKPELKILNDGIYANCGDFQESCSGVIETLEGEFHLIEYKDEEFLISKSL